MITAKYEHDDIARIAYLAWLERGQPDGSPEVDWYYAVSVVTNPEEIQPEQVNATSKRPEPVNEPDSPYDIKAEGSEAIAEPDSATSSATSRSRKKPAATSGVNQGGDSR